MILVGDVWVLQQPNDWIVVPVNIGWKSDGSNPMGRGLALQAAQKYPTLPREYGDACRRWGETITPTPWPQNKLIFFPTKPLNFASPHLSWKNPASFDLIVAGLASLVQGYALGWSHNTYDDTDFDPGRLLVPLLGCGEGGLRPDVIEPLLVRVQSRIPNMAIVRPQPAAANHASVVARVSAVNRAPADADWSLRALAAVKAVARGQNTLTTDDLWKIVEPPEEPRAMGSVMRTAVRAGWISKTDRTVESTRSDCHRRPLAVWRSLIFDM